MESHPRPILTTAQMFVGWVTNRQSFRHRSLILDIFSNLVNGNTSTTGNE
ncbi:hypothetical protein [Nostoc mirabile]|nr:hypothetical protein [Nostoc mirabile]